MQINTAVKSTARTHEGAPTKRISPEQALRRSVLSCLLWEDQFYEDGVSIADRIVALVDEVEPDTVAALALEARSDMNLRHVPLLLTSLLAKNGYKGTADVVSEVIQRADELSELVAVHCHANNVGPDKAKKVLGHQMKKGLATAFQRFDAYQLAKYNRDRAIKLRDVLFMCHAKPKDEEQSVIWKRLVDGTLEAPDTWEVGLSGGSDKKETFERLLREGKLGYMALLRNLRNMVNANVDIALIQTALRERKGAHRVLPFRFVAAARACPQLEPVIDEALVAEIDKHDKLCGKTVVLVDVSGSMDSLLSLKSDLRRIDAAAALASVIPAEQLRVFSFSAGNCRYSYNEYNGGRISVEVPPRRGMAGVEAVITSQGRGGTMLGRAIKEMNEIDYDRLIVITDEQSHEKVSDPKGRGYMINVASYKNGVGYGKWTHIDGFSEAVIRWIMEYEASSLT